MPNLNKVSCILYNTFCTCALEPLVMNLDISVLWFTSTKVISFLYKPFDRYIDPWHRVFCLGHFRWDKPFYSLYKACFEFDPHVINWHVTVVFRKVCVLKLGHVVFKADHVCTFIEIDLAWCLFYFFSLNVILNIYNVVIGFADRGQPLDSIHRGWGVSK